MSWLDRWEICYLKKLGTQELGVELSLKVRNGGCGTIDLQCWELDLLGYQWHGICSRYPFLNSWF